MYTSCILYIQANTGQVYTSIIPNIRRYTRTSRQNGKKKKIIPAWITQINNMLLIYIIMFVQARRKKRRGDRIK